MAAPHCIHVELKRATERGGKVARRTEERKNRGLAKGLRGRKKSVREDDGEEVTLGQRGIDEVKENTRGEREKEGEREETNASRGSGRGNHWIEKRSTMRME